MGHDQEEQDGTPKEVATEDIGRPVGANCDSLITDEQDREHEDCNHRPVDSGARRVARPSRQVEHRSVREQSSHGGPAGEPGAVRLSGDADEIRGRAGAVGRGLEQQAEKLGNGSGQDKRGVCPVLASGGEEEDHAGQPEQEQGRAEQFTDPHERIDDGVIKGLDTAGNGEIGREDAVPSGNDADRERHHQKHDGTYEQIPNPFDLAPGVRVARTWV